MNFCKYFDFILTCIYISVINYFSQIMFPIFDAKTNLNRSSFCVILGQDTRLLVQDFLYQSRDFFRAVTVFCKNKGIATYSKIIPDCFIFDNVESDPDAAISFLEDIVRRQQAVSRNPPPWMKTSENKRVLIIVDNCCYISRVATKFREMSKYLRSFYLSLLVVETTKTKIPTSFFNNMDFMFYQNENENKFIVESYGHHWPETTKTFSYENSQDDVLNALNNNTCVCILPKDILKIIVEYVKFYVSEDLWNA